MKEVGILDMEIYIHGNRLFMIMDTVADFDHSDATKELGKKQRQSEWEAYVSGFQQTAGDTTAGAKWQLMERIHKMNQQKEYTAEKGQVERLHSIDKMLKDSKVSFKRLT